MKKWKIDIKNLLKTSKPEWSISLAGKLVFHIPLVFLISWKYINFTRVSNCFPLCFFSRKTGFIFYTILTVSFDVSRCLSLGATNSQANFTLMSVYVCCVGFFLSCPEIVHVVCEHPRAGQWEEMPSGSCHQKSWDLRGQVSQR